MVDEDILPEQLALFGFSQGTMMALHVAPRREDPVAGVVAISGRLLEPEILVDEVVSHMPVMFVHGDQDEVVPPQSMPEGVEGYSCRFQRCLCSYSKRYGARYSS